MSEIAGEAGRVPSWTIADRVRKARESADMTQGDLAEQTGISRSSISNYEAAATTPRKPQITLIAWATRVDRSWLETGTAPTHDDGPGQLLRARRDSNPQPSDPSERVAHLRVYGTNGKRDAA